MNNPDQIFSNPWFWYLMVGIVFTHLFARFVLPIFYSEKTKKEIEEQKKEPVKEWSKQMEKVTLSILFGSIVVIFSFLLIASWVLCEKQPNISSIVIYFGISFILALPLSFILHRKVGKHFIKENYEEYRVKWINSMRGKNIAEMSDAELKRTKVIESISFVLLGFAILYTVHRFISHTCLWKYLLQ